ncbi:hypothetical protein [Kyrpidia sp.]|uniref:hypothetical protein n=1 Tax=Kyrpidia sp. TaxID=2073077 RepID=UPI00258A16E8|nr:hypothetical protein [Kyrpidia sp.]MCL6577071.1 hypothetical protein [Kyrpidia sp.]
MKDILALADLEFSRFRMWMPFAPGSRPRVVMLNQAVFLLISLWFFRGWTNLGQLYAEWTIFHLFAVIIFSGSLWSTSGGIEWWLTIPRPRMHLVLGRALGCLRMGLHLALYMEATVILHYATAFFLHWVPGTSVSQFAEVAATFTMLDLVALFPAVGVGLIRVVFSRGWARVGGFIYFILLYFILLFGLFNGGNVFNQLWNGAPLVSKYLMIILGIAVIGWPLSWFLVRLTAGVGLCRLGDMRLAETGWGFRLQTSAAPAGTWEVRASRSPFWSLFSLERARQRWWGAGAPPLYRWLFAAAMAGAAVEGYVLMGKQEIWLHGPSFVGAGVYAYAIFRVVGFPTEPFRQGWGSWWLAIPRPRWMLLAARGLAVWTTLVELMSLALMSLGIGITIRGMIGGSWASLADGWRSIGEIWLVITLLFTLNLLLLQITPALFRHRVLSVFLVPLYASVYGEFGWLVKWTVAGGQGPGLWHRLGMLAGIGLPLGLLCFWIGSRSLNQLMLMEDFWCRVERLQRQT